MFKWKMPVRWQRTLVDRDLIVPIEKYGIKLLSIGFFVDPDQATLWRGGYGLTMP